MNPVPPVSIPIVNDDGTITQPFLLFVNQVSRESIIVGTGSPEGVVEGIQTQVYMDDAGTAGAILYIKRDADVAGDRTKGWILV